MVLRKMLFMFKLKEGSEVFFHILVTNETSLEKNSIGAKIFKWYKEQIMWITNIQPVGLRKHCYLLVNFKLPVRLQYVPS